MAWFLVIGVMDALELENSVEVAIEALKAFAYIFSI